MRFDSLFKGMIKTIIGLSVGVLVLGASSLTMTVFYLSSYKQHNLFDAKVLKNIRLTAYRSVQNQTDSSPFHTSIGHRTHPYGCAISRDLIGSVLNYGDIIYIPGFGFRVVNDVMGPKATKSIDLWVASKSDEARVGVRKVTVIILRAN